MPGFAIVLVPRSATAAAMAPVAHRELRREGIARAYQTIAQRPPSRPGGFSELPGPLPCPLRALRDAPAEPRIYRSAATS